MFNQLTDLFHTTHRVKIQQVVKIRGVGTVPLVLDLHITHERWGSSPDPTLNGYLHYPNDLDKPLNEVAVDGYIVNLYEFCSYKLIGKLTTFLQLQESSFRNMIVEASTTTAWSSLVSVSYS